MTKKDKTHNNKETRHASITNRYVTDFFIVMCNDVIYTLVREHR